MGGGSAGLGAAALVDGDIHHHTARPHDAEHFARDELGGFGAGDEHGADKEIHVGEQFHQMRVVRIKRVRGVQRDVEKTHPLDIHLEDGDIRAEAGGHAGGVHATDAAAEHHHFAGQHSRHAAEQRAAAGEMFGKIIAADDDRHAPGDFAHRLEQRQAAVNLDGFVGNGGALAGDERLGQLGHGGEVEVCEKDLAFAQQRGFLRLRFFDLHDQFRLGEDGFVRVANFRAGFCVVRIGIAAARTRAGFRQHAMAALGELVRGGRQQTHTVFFGFYFAGDANNHWRKLAAKCGASNAQCVLH